MLTEQQAFQHIKKAFDAFMNTICKLTAAFHLLVWVPLLAF